MYVNAFSYSMMRSTGEEDDDDGDFDLSRCKYLSMVSSTIAALMVVSSTIAALMAAWSSSDSADLKDRDKSPRASPACGVAPGRRSLALSPYLLE